MRIRPGESQFLALVDDIIEIVVYVNDAIGRCMNVELDSFGTGFDGMEESWNRVFRCGRAEPAVG